MKVNILLLTIDRYELTKDCVGEALMNAGYPFSLCVTDNGSKDERVMNLVQSWSPIYFKQNGFNLGTAQSLNKMIEENPADAWVFIGNDIRMPKDWLNKMVETYQQGLGVIGINWRPVQYPMIEINSVKMWQTDRVFGTMFITKGLRDILGKFCEDYGVYGLWDGEYSLRAELAGLTNVYVYGMKSIHEGHDTEEQSEYRKMKTESLEAAKEKFSQNIKKYKETGKVKL